MECQIKPLLPTLKTCEIQENIIPGDHQILVEEQALMGATYKGQILRIGSKINDLAAGEYVIFSQKSGIDIGDGFHLLQLIDIIATIDEKQVRIGFR